MEPFDIYLMGPSAQGNLALKIDGDALAIRGPAAAAQKFLVNLLNESGSVVFDPAQGTDLLTLLRGGLIRNEAELTSALSLAINDSLIFLSSRIDDSDFVPSEHPVSVEILGVLLETPDQADISLRLRTAAGDEVEFTAPFKV